MTKFGNVVLVLASALLASCATNIKPTVRTNPPPQETFSAFAKYELNEIVLSPTYAKNGANIKATRKIQDYFDERVKPVVETWKENSRQGDRTLVIEPRIEHIKFIGGGARFFAGPMAGSSAVVMKVRYFDKATGKVIAEPEFYQRAAAMSGAMTFGGQDNAMLARIATLVANYTSRNYDHSVGGETGADADTELAAN
jgi:hypothetical protein